MQLRTWIIDDEMLARDRLRRLLRSCPEVKLIAEFGSAQDALTQVLTERPDLIFLDVQMPGLNGLDFAMLLRGEYRPAIIFVTAFEAFAVSAFAVEAVDYLLKPFDAERLVQAVARAREWVAQRRNGPAPIPACAPSGNSDRLAVRVDGRVLILRPAEIEWVEAANNYVAIHLADGRRLMVRMTLAAFGGRLQPGQFLRVNRSAIANVDHVLALKPTNYGDYELVLRNGTSLWISRARRPELLQLVKGGARM